ncbi:MAG: hypothetical protein ACJ8IR_14020 [Alphaproteobacteria bacterium]|jgi:hypothetical protein
MGAAGLAVTIVVFAVAFATVGVLAGRRLFREQVAPFHNEVVISLFSTAGVVYAVLLGFLVVVVWEGYDNAHRNSAEEAATAITLYRLTYGMEPAHGADARKFIRAYIGAVITDEWPMMTKGSNRKQQRTAVNGRTGSPVQPVEQCAEGFRRAGR